MITLITYAILFDYSVCTKYFLNLLSVFYLHLQLVTLQLLNQSVCKCTNKALISCSMATRLLEDKSSWRYYISNTVNDFICFTESRLTLHNLYCFSFVVIACTNLTGVYCQLETLLKRKKNLSLFHNNEWEKHFRCRFCFSL